MASCGILCEGDFSPSVIFDTFSSSDDTARFLRDYLRAYPEYNPETDPGITENPKLDPGASMFLISIARFQVSAETLSNGKGDLWNTVSTGLSVGMAGVALGGEGLGGNNEPVGGVYSIRNPNDMVVRVGRTKDLSGRVGQYSRDPNYFDLEFRVEYRTDSYQTQRGLEQLLYEWYKPPMNLIKPIRDNNLSRTDYMDSALNFLKQILDLQ
jgi:hypothetical protein